MKKFKKIVAITLAATMLTSMSQMSLSAFAATVQSESVSAYSGSCGDNVQYELDISTGTLTISGTGAMKDYNYNNTPWYNYRNSVKSLVINDGVTYISGFRNCSNLASVSLPESVTAIGYDAFYSCSKLTDVSIPNSVTTIGAEAFRNCSSLVNISIPESVTTIAEYLFWDCSSLANVSIPESVTTIGNRAFSGCSSLTGITIPESVTTIDESAFDGCSSLTDITIPDSVTDLGDYAFQDCTGLETLKLSANIKEIKRGVFANCNSLTSVNIPVGVESIGSSAFENCRDLNELSLSNTVKEIGSSAFSGTNLSKVFIPDTVLSLQNDSFSKYYGAPVVLVSSIGSPAHWVRVDDHNEEFGFESTGEYYKGSGTCGNNAVFTFDAESGLLTISGTGDMKDYNVFNWGSQSDVPWFCFRKGIKNVVIEDGITSIGDASFSHCEYLETVYIPNSVTKISGINRYSQNETVKLVSCEGGPAESFANTNGFKFESTGEYFTASGKCGENITYTYDGKTKALVLSGTGATYDFEWVDGNPGHYEYPWYTYKDSIESVVINEGITSVDVNSIEGNKIKTIDIPASLSKLTQVGTEVECFYDYNLDSLERFNVASGNPLFTDIDGVLFNSNKTILMFYPSMHGENYVIPDGVLSIDGGAFSDNKNIKSIVMPDTVQSLPTFAFSSCSALESVVLSNSLTSISDYTFMYCTSLKQVVIPNDVTSIGDSAFQECRALQSVVIPDGVTSIGDSAFQECQALQSVVIPEGVTFIGNSTFYECQALQSVVIPEGVTSIGNSAFSRCQALQSVVIPEGVTSIGNSAFDRCQALQSVIIPNGVTSIDSYTFYECKALQSVVIPDSVTSIGSSAFSGCRALQSVVIPNGVTSIGNNTFYYCNSLRTLVIPESVTSINSNAIYMQDKSILVIYGVPGSAAHTYAKKNNITFCDINEVVEPSVVGYSVSLGGDIGLNYFVALDYKTINKDVKMTFVNEATGKEITTLGLYDSSNAVIDGKLYYKFTCPVSASHMADKIKPVLTIDGVAYEFNVYSVKDYAEVILGDEKYATAAPVVKSMLNYGAYSEIALLGVTTSDTNSALTAEEKQLGEVSLSVGDYSLTSGDEAYSDYVQYAGSRISLKNETVIKHYFKIDESKVDPSTLYISGSSKETSIVKDGEYYRVDIKGINAKNLYTDYDFDIKCSDNYWYFRSYSVATYINSALNSTTISDEVKDTVKALYFFYQATYNYSKNS